MRKTEQTERKETTGYIMSYEKKIPKKTMRERE